MKPNPTLQFQPLLDEYVEFWNTGSFEGIGEVLHPDFELRMTPRYEAEVGVDAFKNSVTMWRTMYPDFHITVDELFFSENAAAARWTITATNTGDGPSPPTRKAIQVPGLSLFHFEDGKIKDEWIASNNMEWRRQLGFTLTAPRNK
jgi:steroid delta-isomerase-like uncharacterized protein